MIVYIKSLLNRNELEHIRQSLAQVAFRDGRATANSLARANKNNLEFSAAGSAQQQLDELVIGRLYAHPDCQALLPYKIAHPYYARYETGMAYGDHTDEAIMGGDNRYRSDIAVTIFLNGSSEYRGGALTVNTQTPPATHSIHGGAGDAVLYPATSMHRVETVTDGVRLVAVAWIQSLIRDPSKRELVYQLGALRTQLMQQMPNDHTAAQKANWLYNNLVRMWADL